MTDLILSIVAASVIASLWLIVPAIKARRFKLTENSQQIEIYQTKMTELNNDLAQGTLSQTDFDSAYQELKQQLAFELATQKQNSQVSGVNKAIFFVLPVLVVGASLAVYLLQGRYAAMENWQQAKQNMPELARKIVMQQSQDVSVEDLQQFYLGLRTKLQTQSDDAMGWLLLGRVASSIRDFEAAIAAFERSIKLEPNKPSSYLSFAQVLLSRGQDGDINRAAAALDNVLKLEPNNTDAAIMAGFVAFQQKNDDKAKYYWQPIVANLSSADARVQRILQIMPELATGQPESNGSLLAQGPKLEVSLRSKEGISEAYQYLFVFARPAKKGPPYAVKKIALTNGLPETLVLNNADSMVPGLNLSAMTSGFVTVRLSTDGDVALGEQDREWHSEQIQIEQQTKLTVAL